VARISRKIALTDAELEELMTSTWNLRIATVGAGGRINLTPMWFGWVQGKIYFTGRGQKIVNLRRNPRATVLVDRNERFPELIGAMFQGTARVLENADEERADADLEAARVVIGTKYAGGHGEADTAPRRRDTTATGETNRWVVFTPDHVVTWDNAKIAALLAARRGQ
jgi:nitroimidazol reductase NimA-like FMN-containing flavoprotein (pyridoxamine 5'-phosphate oxidase superfamily)